MRKVTDATFKFFCRKVRYWLKQFGVTDWTVFFAQEKRDDCEAGVRIDYENRGLTFVLPTYLDDTSRRVIDHSAIHEVAHAALAQLDYAATARWVTEKEVEVAVEATVCRITTLISNLSKPQRSRG